MVDFKTLMMRKNANKGFLHWLDKRYKQSLQQLQHVLIPKFHENVLRLTLVANPDLFTLHREQADQCRRDFKHFVIRHERFQCSHDAGRPLGGQDWAARQEFLRLQELAVWRLMDNICRAVNEI